MIGTRDNVILDIYTQQFMRSAPREEDKKVMGKLFIEIVKSEFMNTHSHQYDYGHLALHFEYKGNKFKTKNSKITTVSQML